MASEASFVDDFADGIDTIVGERGVGLSGGQRQRIALGPGTGRQSGGPACSTTPPHRSIRAPRRGCWPTSVETLSDATVVAVASRPSTIALADDVLYLADGRVVAHGRHDELLVTVPEYRRLMEAFEHERAEHSSEVERMTRPVDNEPISRWSAVQMIGKGVEAAPALRRGIGATFAFAMVGAAGRVVVPILVQQAIDRGLKEGQVDVGVVMVLGLIGVVVIIIATVCSTHRSGTARDAQRRGALRAARASCSTTSTGSASPTTVRSAVVALVARVTSDVETLSQFFSWGALAWLLDGTLMVMVAGVMLAYDWMLALVAFVTAAPLAFVLRSVQRHLVQPPTTRPGSRNAEVLTSVSEVVSGRRDPAGVRRGPALRVESPSSPAINVRTRSSGPTRSAHSCSRRARCSAC